MSRSRNSGEELPEIGAVTNLRSRPHRFFSRVLPWKSERLPISPFKMLFGREINLTGRARFTSSDCCHLSSKYMHTNCSLIDRMNSPAYVSQFSADGTLFVAGFQGVIKIYSVDNGWKLEKNIHASSLGWAITDASLSPDQLLLAYSSVSPVVRILNVGSYMTESVANTMEMHKELHFPGHGHHRIFAVKFSPDGKELVAASSDNSIYVYDLVANKLNVRTPAHRRVISYIQGVMTTFVRFGICDVLVQKGKNLESLLGIFKELHSLIVMEIANISFQTEKIKLLNYGILGKCPQILTELQCLVDMLNGIIE